MLSHALRRVSVRPIQLLLAPLLLAPLLAFSSPAGPASSGVAVAGGTITSASGAAMAGQTVDLYAWPSDAVLQALKPGQFVPTTLLATATTSSTGAYMLKVPDAKLKAAAVESGYANLEIFSAMGGIWFLPYQTASLPAQSPAPVTVDLGNTKQLTCGVDSVGYHDVFTGFSLEYQRQHTWGVVGQGYIVQSGNKTKGDYVTFQYNQGNSHTQVSALGVGVSGYGVDAGYDGSGSNMSTATRTEGYAHHKGNAAFRTLFKVGQFRGLCIGPQGVQIHHQKQHGKCPSTYKNDLGQMFWVKKCFWRVASIGWFGGTSTTVPSKAPTTPSKFCAPHEAKSNYNGDLGTAQQWSSGFELGASLGIKGVKLKASFNSSAQTGYDVNARMYFHFGANGGHLCGTNGSEASAAVLVERR